MMRISQSNNLAFNSNISTQKNNQEKNISDITDARNDTNSSIGSDELSPDERKQVEELKQIERKVEAHEQAHKSAGGQFAGSMSYSYTQGPDGQKYRTGGEVSISVPSNDDPEKLIAQLMQVRRAALAPADPSPQDVKVAGMVDGKIQAARAKIREKYTQERQEKNEEESFDLKV